MPNEEHDGIGVVHCDPFTGIVFDPTPPFDKYNERPNPSAIPFDSRDDAIRYCESIVSQYPHLECTVVGDPTGEGFVLTNPEWIEQESQRRQTQQQLHAEKQRSSLWLFSLSLITLTVLAIVLYIVFWA